MWLPDGHSDYFYPRSPYGERPSPRSKRSIRHNISIHALLTESDVNPYKLTMIFGNFYPRSPYGERPQQTNNQEHPRTLFLSTLSLRRATFQTSKLCNLLIFLSTLSLRRATTRLFIPPIPTSHFYPRSPYGERRMALALCFYLCWYFYPRSPYGERLCACKMAKNRITISIHALLTESDW